MLAEFASPCTAPADAMQQNAMRDQAASDVPSFCLLTAATWYECTLALRTRSACCALLRSALLTGFPLATCVKHLIEETSVSIADASRAGAGVSSGGASCGHRSGSAGTAGTERRACLAAVKLLCANSSQYFR